MRGSYRLKCKTVYLLRFDLMVWGEGGGGGSVIKLFSNLGEK